MNVVIIIDSGVFNMAENSLSLSKDGFASNILHKTPPFDSVSIDHFKGVFNKMNEIISR